MLLNFVARIRIRNGRGFEHLETSVQAADLCRAKLFLEAQFGVGNVVNIRRT